MKFEYAFKKAQPRCSPDARSTVGYRKRFLAVFLQTHIVAQKMDRGTPYVIKFVHPLASEIILSIGYYIIRDHNGSLFDSRSYGHTWIPRCRARQNLLCPRVAFFISLSFSGGARQTSSQIANGRVLAPQHKNDQLLLKGKSKERKMMGNERRQKWLV